MPMKNAFKVGIISLLTTAVAGGAATTPIYINDAPVECLTTPPQIDATAFLNRSFFCSQNFSLLTPLPYETLNTLFFTNAASGRMLGDPGYRFNYAHGNVRGMMDTWVNRGSITVDSSVFFISGANPNWLLVSATNIISTGPLSVGSQGLLRLEGHNINLSRDGLRSGQSLTNNGLIFGTFVGSSNYINDFGITDLYWGTGTNNALDDMGSPLVLSGFGGAGSLIAQPPIVRSPSHQVIQRLSGFSFTNTVTVPQFSTFGEGYDARVLTTQTGATNFTVQVVFFPTNSFETNLATTVEFLPGFGLRNGARVLVGFHTEDFDIVNQVPFTNSVYLIDALAFRTNTALARNLSINTRRPINYEVLRNRPFFGTGVTPTNVFTPDLLFRPTMASNEVEVIYAGYQAQVSSINTPGLTIPGNPLANPTNFPGRIEIFGDTVDLTETRIRADSTIVIRAENLVSNQFAQVDAPFVVFNVGSSQPTLVISNIAPPTVARLSGTVSAWSGTWRNFETVITQTSTNVNAIDFHVLIVDHTLQGRQPVQVSEFTAQAANIALMDPLAINNTFRLDATGLVNENALTLPFGSSWARTNVLNLRHLTNHGVITLSGSGFFGSDRAEPYENFINTGSISGASLFVNSTSFDNSGHLEARSGLLSVDAVDARIAGLPTVITTNFFTNIVVGATNVFALLTTNSFGPLLVADADVVLTASDLVLSNAIIQAGVLAPGALIVDVADRLWAPRESGTNRWIVQAGVNMVRKPAESDLFGTHIISIAPPFRESVHFWPADDLGATEAGYMNNLAVGRMTLDGRSSLSRFKFVGQGANRALYVDYLQLENFATNINTSILVESGFTLYFADANVSPRKLSTLPGIRWVHSFAGPFSSTNLTYPSGQVYTFNRGLVTSRDDDSDGDGIPNFFDDTPIFVEDDIALAVTTTAQSGGGAGGASLSGPDHDLVISWNALGAYATNILQYSESLEPDATWQTMTQLVSGPMTTRVHIMEPMPSTSGQRFYRVKVEPSQR